MSSSRPPPPIQRQPVSTSVLCLSSGNADPDAGGDVESYWTRREPTPPAVSAGDLVRQAEALLATAVSEEQKKVAEKRLQISIARALLSSRSSHPRRGVLLATDALSELAGAARLQQTITCTDRGFETARRIRIAYAPWAASLRPMGFVFGTELGNGLQDRLVLGEAGLVGLGVAVGPCALSRLLPTSKVGDPVLAVAIVRGEASIRGAAIGHAGVGGRPPSRWFVPLGRGGSVAVVPALWPSQTLFFYALRPDVSAPETQSRT